MEARKTIVNELNELAYKMTGVNPKATTDAGALNYIEQNYSGGGSSGNEAIIIDISDLDGAYYDNDIEVTQDNYPNVYASINNAFEKAYIDENGKCENTNFIIKDGNYFSSVNVYNQTLNRTNMSYSEYLIELNQVQLWVTEIVKGEDTYTITYREIFLTANN